MIYCNESIMTGDGQMIKIDLITGFLGSGKTTFIKRYVDWLMEHRLRVGILENDFGAVNVDMMLLNDLQNSRCDIETVAGACDADCHKRRFKTKLIAMGMSGYDRVIVEPSGIFDTDEFFDTLREEPLDRWYEIGSVITVVDAALDTNMSEQSEYIFASQLANAGKVIMSKTDVVSDEKLEETVQYVRSVCEKYCGRMLGSDIITKKPEEITVMDMSEIAECGYKRADFVKRFKEENGYGSLYYMKNDIPLETLKQRAEMIFKDEECGKVYRIKGFVKNDGQWYEFNADASSISASPAEVGQDIIIVIGEQLNRNAVDAYFKPEQAL